MLHIPVVAVDPATMVVVVQPIIPVPAGDRPICRAASEEPRVLPDPGGPLEVPPMSTILAATSDMAACSMPTAAADT